MKATRGEIRQRSRQAATAGGIAAVALYTGGGVWLRSIEGFVLVSGPGAGVAQTPLQQTVSQVVGAWYVNFSTYPLLWLLPGLAILALLVGIVSVRSERGLLAWWLGALAWVGVIGSAGAAMFPFMLPSITIPNQSLTLWNASSSSLTLAWMLGFTVVFIPLIVWYTSWAFYVMRGKVDEAEVKANDHAY